MVANAVQRRTGHGKVRNIATTLVERQHDVLIGSPQLTGRNRITPQNAAIPRVTYRNRRRRGSRAGFLQAQGNLVYRNGIGCRARIAEGERLPGGRAGSDGEVRRATGICHTDTPLWRF